MRGGGIRSLKGMGFGAVMSLSAALSLPLALAPARPALAQILSQGAAPLPATLMADEIFVDPAGRLVASGAVEVWQGSVRLTATRVVYDQRGSGQLSLEGPLTLSDGPDTLIVADQGALSADLRHGLMESARLVLYQQLQVAAERMERDGNLTRMDAVIASSCEVCAARPTPLWEIRAARITHDAEAQTLRFDQAQFRLRGVPIAHFPRLTLPDGSVDRARGVLRPELRISSELGARIAVPYFIPFGADRDLTLTPQASTLGMVSLGMRWRHATRRGGYELGGQLSRDDLTPDDWRGYAYLRALFGLRGGLRLEVDAIASSDRNYLETYGLTDTARLTSQATLERIRRDEAIRARALVFRSLRPADVNDELPSRIVQAEWEQRIGGLPVGGDLTLSGRFHFHERPSRTDGDAGRDIGRAALHARWQRREILAGGIVASLALQGRLDHLRIRDDSTWPEPVTRRAAEGMLEFRWPWAGVDDGGGQQLIEPVVQLIGARRSLAVLPNEDHLMPELDEGSLFAPIRHSGFDVPDDGSRANLGLRWMRHAPGGWSIETLVGRVHRREALTGFDPGHRQPLGGLRSDWLLAGRVTTQDGVALGVRLLFDDRSDLSRGEASITFARGERTSLVSRYLYVNANAAEARANPLNEWSLDIDRRFRNGWVGRVGWDYHIGTGEWGEARTGLEFRNECLEVDLSLSRRFASSTNLTASTNFGLRVELLGLSGRSTGASGRTCRT